MDKITLWNLVSTFLSEAKDPKTLLFRMATTFILILIFNLISNPEFFLEAAKQVSREAVMEQLTNERTDKFPKLARERVSLIISQSRADLVLVTKYDPKYVNSREVVIAAEGPAYSKDIVLVPHTVDKTTELYQIHLVGRDVALRLDSVNEYDYLVHDTFERFRKLGISFMYTCPYFDLDNLYTGYIAIGWKERPKVDNIEAYLFKICAPHARALGRSI